MSHQSSTKKKELPAINGMISLASLITILSLLYVLGTRSIDYEKLNAIFPFIKYEKKVKPKEEVVLDPTALATGTNHNNAASSYAYDTAEIRAYMRGEKEYTGEKLVFITIDDGANHNITPRILDILKDQQVPATFFVIGRTVYDEFADVFQRQIAEGHAIGLHSVSHDMGLLYPGGVPNVTQILSEAQEEQQYLKNILGADFNSKVWRYPGGAMSWQGIEESNAVLAQNGFEWIDWNASVGDAEAANIRPNNLQEMLDYHTLSYSHFPESDVRVVLMHDAYDKELTVEALPHIIKYYRDQGYKFGVLS